MIKMESTWQSRFEKIKQQIKNDCRVELTHLIANRGKQVEKSVILDFKTKITRRWDDLYKAKEDNINQRDRFKIDIIDTFNRLKGSRYEEKDYVDTFLEYEISKIREHHLNLFSNADTIIRKTNYFNESFLFKSTNEEIVELIASYLAYEELHDEFYKKAFNIQEKLKEIRQKELKKVVNNFNKMPPLEVYEYFLQLTQTNSKTKNDPPILDDESVYELTLRICKNEFPVNKRLQLNITYGQTDEIIKFFADYRQLCLKKGYEYKQNTVKKYFNILLDNFTNFASLEKNQSTYSRFSKTTEPRINKKG